MKLAILMAVLTLSGCGPDRLAEAQARYAKAAEQHDTTNDLLRQLVALHTPATPEPAGETIEAVEPTVSDDVTGGLAQEGPAEPPEALDVSTETPETGQPTDRPQVVEDRVADEPQLEPGLVGSPGTDAGQTAVKTWPVYSLRVGRGRGSAVAVSGRRAVTAQHMGSGAAEIEIDGDWHKCRLTAIPNTDAAWVDLIGTEELLPSVEIVPAVYGEQVTIYGMRTKEAQPGFIVNTGYDTTITENGRRRIEREAVLAVEAEGSGIDEGDSGGGVFDLDGNLIGVLSAYVEGEHRHVTYAPLAAVQSPVSQNVAASAKPVLTIYSEDWCAPCQRLKAAIRDKQLSEFDIVEPKTLPGWVKSIPTIEFTTANGATQRIIGFDASTISTIKRLAR